MHAPSVAPVVGMASPSGVCLGEQDHGAEVTSLRRNWTSALPEPPVPMPPIHLADIDDLPELPRSRSGLSFQPRRDVSTSPIALNRNAPAKLRSCSGSRSPIRYAPPEGGDTTAPASHPSFSTVGRRHTAAEILQKLAPDCAATVLARLRRERIRSAADLAGLDKDDLRELGLSMVERSRVLRWSYKVGSALVAEAAAAASTTPGGLSTTPEPTPGTPGTLLDSGFFRMLGMDNGLEEPSEDGRAHAAPSLRSRPRRELDDACLEERCDFWCALAQSVAPSQEQLSQDPETVAAEFRDVREKILEERFDLTEERVAEIYESMRAGFEAPGSSRKDGFISLAELRQGLQRCGLPSLNDAVLKQVLDAVAEQRCSSLSLAEFDALLSRLKLAQLLLVPGVQGLAAGTTLSVVDYNAQSHHAHTPEGAQQLRKFFFGHRREPRAAGESNYVRWINLKGMNMTLLLALMVKYGLHPLSVEDVIEQCPTKLDCYGGHYFLAVEQLVLAEPCDGSMPVRVRGCHASVFCSGPPRFDTFITVTQADRSFAEDWPQVDGEPTTGKDLDSVAPPWAHRLRDRLFQLRSRLRERRSESLMYQVIDLSTDELVAVVRAYTLRLGSIDFMLRHRESLANEARVADPEWLTEVALSRIQLAVVARRVRGLQRVLRHVSDDPDITAGLSSYLQDVKDHLDEAHEDTAHLREKCEAIVVAYERAVEREQERVRGQAAARLNMILFVLTMATAIFAPVQFLTGVYGMNFQGEDGEPGIPELRWANGYVFFWVVVLIYFATAVLFAGTAVLRLWRQGSEETNFALGPAERRHIANVAGAGSSSRGGSPTLALGAPAVHANGRCCHVGGSGTCGGGRRGGCAPEAPSAVDTLTAPLLQHGCGGCDLGGNGNSNIRRAGGGGNGRPGVGSASADFESDRHSS
eukprot:TRINITY_DN16651_c0_g2_i1.p1 TRINITY_DN16651_c0_g2~~TRINITY_DN16651_c0_g2_i1.p1  ORF type:complete len:923 (-),score=141.25 TRINITY_DN16651_c0_g2_i1:165-2933(-)